MPVSITDVDTFTDPIQAPADADPADRTYVVTIAQGLANRTRRILNMLGGNGAATVSRTIFIGPTALRTAGVQTFFAYVQLNQNTQAGFIDIADYLPSGAVLKEVHLGVKPGAARAGGARMLMKVYRQAVSGWPGTDPPTATQLGSDQEDAGSNAAQFISQTGLSETVDRDTNSITLQIQAGNTAGTGGQEDRVYMLKLVFDDVGPRAW